MLCILSGTSPVIFWISVDSPTGFAQPQVLEALTQTEFQLAAFVILCHIIVGVGNWLRYVSNLE